MTKSDDDAKAICRLINELTAPVPTQAVLRQRLSEIDEARNKLHAEAQAVEEQLRRRMQIDELKSRAKGLAKRVRELEERDDQKRLPVNPFATPKLTLVP